MRPSLLPGLLAAAARNAESRRDGGAAVRDRPPLSRRRRAPDARRWCSPATSGARGWQAGKAAPFDAFDAKAEALALLAAAGAPVDNLQVMGEAGDDLASRPVGHAPARPEDGARARSACSTRDAPRRSTSTARSRRSSSISTRSRRKRGERLHARPPTRRPRCRRCSATSPSSSRPDLTADALVRAVRGADKAAITAARLFDRVRDATASESMAVEVTLQPGDKSFTDADIEAISDRIVAAAEKLGARLRG